MKDYSKPLDFFDVESLNNDVYGCYMSSKLVRESMRYGFRYGYAVGLANACKILGCDSAEIDELLKGMIPK